MKKNTMRLFALLLALMMVLVLAACGGDDPADDSDLEDGVQSDSLNNNDTPADGDGGVTGSTDGFGDFASILVPEEFRFERDSWNEENPHYVSVKRSDFAYFDFRNFTDEEELMKEYEYVKKTYTNEQQDVSANYGGIDWTGFQYGDGYGGYGFEAYAIIGNNYLKVASGGFAFDNEIAQAILGSVVMTDGGESGTADGSETSDTPDDSVISGEPEVGGEEDLIPEWMKYWTGDWYGWWLLTDGTGLYADEDGSAGVGIWDACARIEAYEDTTGTMELWDSEGNCNELIAILNLSFANPDDSQYGVMCCRGGQFFNAEVEDDAWYVNPDELSYENIFDFRGDYEDEYGTFSYRVLLRPWGVEWDDLGEDFYPEYYNDWYLPLLQSGAAMPDSIG